MDRFPALSLCTVLALVACGGCKTLEPTWATKWMASSPEVEESKYPRPARLAAIWSPAVLNQAGKPPTRGFGGRLYFYDANNQPIPVEGQLVVYAYDDSKPNADGKTPDRKYAFTPEQFTQHVSPTDLGTSYSIWIPWDEAGKPQADISLVPVFTATNGQLVMGQPSKNLLPGPRTEHVSGPTQRFTMPQPVQHDMRTAPVGNAYAVQQTSFEQVANPISTLTARDGIQYSPATNSNVQTMSITLPGTLADRLSRAAPQTRRPLDVYRIMQEQQPPASSPQTMQPQATAASQASASLPPWSRSAEQQPGRFGRPRFQAPGTAGPPQAGGQPLTQQLLPGQPSGHPSTLGLDQSLTGPAGLPGGVPVGQ